MTEDLEARLFGLGGERPLPPELAARLETALLAAIAGPERAEPALVADHGDVLLQGPAVRAVAAGSRRVTLLCGPRGEAAARLLPGVDEVVVYSAEWIDPEPRPQN